MEAEGFMKQEFTIASSEPKAGSLSDFVKQIKKQKEMPLHSEKFCKN